MALDTVKLIGRDAAKELTLKVNISQVFTIAVSETKSIVNHNSQSDGPNRSAKRWTNWQNKITRTISLQRNSKDTKGQWYLTLNKSGKNTLVRLRPDFRAAVSLRNPLYRESGEQVAEPISPAQKRRWHFSSSDSWWDTSDWSWWSSQSFLSDFFVTVGFVYR